VPPRWLLLLESLNGLQLPCEVGLVWHAVP